MKRVSTPPVLALLVLAASAFSAGCRTGTVRASTAGIPEAIVQQGNVQIKVTTTGTLKPTNSRIITAPPIGGGTLQIIHLARTGTSVHQGDMVLEFDPAEQEYNLAQSRNDLAQAEEEIVKAKADAEVQTAEDKTALLKAKFAVRRAELDVSKNDLLSEIDAQKNQLALDEARRGLAQLEQDILSHSTSNQAALALSEEKRNKARLAMKQAQENIQNMRVKSPLDGLIVLHGNANSSGGMFFQGMIMPDYQPGDQVYPGTTIGDVIDISQMEISAQVEEGDRPFLKIGQRATITVDAMPGLEFPGTISNVAGAAIRDFWGTDSHGKFEIKITFDHADPRLRPGFSARMMLFGENIPHISFVPREAIFQKDGKTIVYAKLGGAWTPREVKVHAYSEGRALLEDLDAGTVIALINPEKQSPGRAKPVGSSGPVLGAGSQ